MKIEVFLEDKNFRKFFKFNKEQFKRFIKSKIEKFFDLEKIESLNIIICDNLKIKAFNKKYRGKNRPTDVLSFNYHDPDLKTGEIYLSYEFLKDQSQTSTKTLDFLLLRALIHGVVHLMGYDHKNDKQEVKMRKVEKSLLTELREDFKIIKKRAASSAG